MQKGFFVPLLLDSQHGINLLLHLESVPLGDGSPGVGQHVWPVSQLGTGAVVAHKDFADGIVLANLVIVQNSYHHLHFLKEDTKMHKCQPALQTKPWDTQSFRGSWGMRTKNPLLTTRKRLKALDCGNVSPVFVVLSLHHCHYHYCLCCHRYLIIFGVGGGSVLCNSDWV